MLVNRQSGTFNLLGPDNYLVDATGDRRRAGPPGRIHRRPRATPPAPAPTSCASRPTSTVSLVDAATVEAAARLEGSVRVRVIRPGTAAGPGRTVVPRGFAAAQRRRSPTRPGAAAVAGGDLWALVEAGSRMPGCSASTRSPSGHQGSWRRRRPPCPGPARVPAVEAGPGPGRRGHARPGPLSSGRRPGAGPADVPVPGTTTATRLPSGVGPGRGAVVPGPGLPTGWSILGVTLAGRRRRPVAARPVSDRPPSRSARSSRPGCSTPSTRPPPASPPCGPSSPPPAP